MDKILLTNIQRFSLHDGPGIRTTIFLKGCSLRCPWCSNPENLNPYPEEYIKDGNRGIYGKEYTIDEIFNEVIKDKDFYESNGGVTFSGGEALLQAERILPALKRFKENRITTAVETCLFIPTEKLQQALPYIDFFYVDMKIIDEQKCLEQLKGDINLYKKNLELLCSQKKIIIRIPVIGAYTDDEKNRNLVIEELKKYKNSLIKIEILKGHNLGKQKYISLGWKMPKFIEVSETLLLQYKTEIENAINIPVELCRI